MPGVNVNIQPAVLNWAINQTKEELIGSKLMNNIKHWLNGTKIPTFKQIEEFSKKTNIPLGYFFLKTPPVEKIELLEYRTVDSRELTNPSRNLIDTIREMERVQDWMNRYRQETGFDKLPVVGSLRGESNVEKIANQIRNDLDLEVEWYKRCESMTESFNYIRERLAECGILVMLNGVVGKNTHRALSVDEFRAFAMVDEWAPLIFINNADSKGAKLFSLFHEIVHVWLGVDDLYNDRRDSANVKPVEVVCNAVAGELLIPSDVFGKKWKEIGGIDEREKINILAKTFKCSASVVARKALDAKKIKKKMYDEIIHDAIKEFEIMKRSKEASGGDYYNTAKVKLDSRFVRALCESINSGRTSFSEAYRLTNSSRKTFVEIATRLGGVV